MGMKERELYNKWERDSKEDKKLLEPRKNKGGSNNEKDSKSDKMLREITSEMQEIVIASE